MRWRTNKKTFFFSFLLSFVFLGSCCVHQNQNPFFGSHTLRKAKKAVIKIDGFTTIKLTTTSTTKISQISLKFRTVASGSIVKHHKGLSMILTAAHVCGFVYKQQISIFKNFVGPNEKVSKIKIDTQLMATDIEGRIFSARQVHLQKRSDTCIIVTNRIPQNALDIASNEVEIGEEVFNIGLPNGIWAPNFIPMFDGRYLGHFYFSYDRSKISCYSIPTAPGQSGSPIINSQGQVIGMIHSVYRRYNHLSLASTLEQIQGVIDFGVKQVENDYKKYKKSLDV